jgi:hypothetical protein
VAQNKKRLGVEREVMKASKGLEGVIWIRYEVIVESGEGAEARVRREPNLRKYTNRRVGAIAKLGEENQ